MPAFVELSAFCVEPKDISATLILLKFPGERIDDGGDEHAGRSRTSFKIAACNALLRYPSHDDQIMFPTKIYRLTGGSGDNNQESSKTGLKILTFCRMSRISNSRELDRFDRDNDSLPYMRSSHAFKTLPRNSTAVQHYPLP